MKDFRRELEELINQHSMENESNTPDFILARYLTDSLKAFDKAINAREAWYNRLPSDKKSVLLKDKFEKIANEINYHNECAKATLGDTLKITAEDLAGQKLSVYQVRYANPLVGDKKEALYYTCKAFNTEDAKDQAMCNSEFTKYIHMKYFNKKYLISYKLDDNKEYVIGMVEYYTGDPRF